MVNQRRKNDCAIAAVANAANTSYKSVKDCFGPLRNGVNRHELEWILGEFCLWNRVRIRSGQTTAEWLASHKKGTFLLVTSHILDQMGHVVAIIDGAVMGELSDSQMPTYAYRVNGIKNQAG